MRAIMWAGLLVTAAMVINGCSSSSSAGTVTYTEETIASLDHIGPIVPTSSGLFVMRGQTVSADSVYSTDLTDAGTELLFENATLLTVDSQAGVWRGRAIVVDWDIVTNGYADYVAIWLTDGTPAGTEMVSELDTGAMPFQINYARLDRNRLIIMGSPFDPNLGGQLGDPKIISIDLE